MLFRGLQIINNIIMQIKFIEKIGERILKRTESLGRIVLFFSIGIIHIFTRPFQFSKILEQIIFIGNKSLSVIALTGFLSIGF